MGYNVAHNPIGAVPNAPMASAPGKELHPLILSTLEIHGKQVTRDRDRDYVSIFLTLIFWYYYSFSLLCIYPYSAPLWNAQILWLVVFQPQEVAIEQLCYVDIG